MNGRGFPEACPAGIRLNTALLVVARSNDHSLTVVAPMPLLSRDRKGVVLLALC